MRTFFTYNGETLWRESDGRGGLWYYAHPEALRGTRDVTEAYADRIATERDARFEINVVLPEYMSRAEATAMLKALIEGSPIPVRVSSVCEPVRQQCPKGIPECVCTK
jgi:hypothetical protein